MRSVIHHDLTLVMSKLASMKQFTTTNGAADLFQKFNNDTNGMAEIDNRINDYQGQQKQVLLRIKNRIQQVQDGNLSYELSEGLKEWVADIHEVEVRSEQAAQHGLELLVRACFFSIHSS